MTTPSHYLNQCFTTDKIQWHLLDSSNFTGNAQDINRWNMFDYQNYVFKIQIIHPRGQLIDESVACHVFFKIKFLFFFFFKFSDWKKKYSSCEKLLPRCDPAPTQPSVIQVPNILWITHWGRGNMAAISQTFSNAFCWMQMFEFLSIFHWIFFPKDPVIYQHWFW